MKYKLLFLAIYTIATGLLYAGGFNLYEFGARASSMGGTGVAYPWDASTIFYNPSGIAFLEGTQFYGGLDLVTSKAKFTGNQPILGGTEHETKENWFTPIHFYFSQKFNEKLAAGIGVANPFGLGVEWKDDFPGRIISRSSEIISFYVSPVVAYALSEGLSVSGGLDVVFSRVELKRRTYIFDSPGSIGYEVAEVTLKGGSDVGVGFTASLMYKSEKGGIGFMYRHKVKQKFKDGDATFEIFQDLSVPNTVAIATGALIDQNVSTELTYPNIAVAGIYHKPFDWFGYEINVNWFGWSTVDQLVLNFSAEDPDDQLPTQTVHLNYSDSWQLRVGVNFKPTEKLDIYGGYIYDITPQPIESVGPLLPDANRSDFSIGAGYAMGKFRVDAGAMLVNFEERSTVEDGEGKNDNGFDGTYNSLANLYFLSLGFNL